MRGLAVIVGALVALATSAGVASAYLSSQSSARTTVSTLSVAAVAGADASTADACASVQISWLRSLQATTYDIEVKHGAGAWATFVTGTGDVTSATDTAPMTGEGVQYRITSRHAISGWTGASDATLPLAC